jgi:hypothetical protein
MEDRIKIDLHENVADVRLTRADKMNALDDAMFSALVATGEKLKTHKGQTASTVSQSPAGHPKRRKVACQRSVDSPSIDPRRHFRAPCYQIRSKFNRE